MAIKIKRNHFLWILAGAILLLTGFAIRPGLSNRNAAQLRQRMGEEINREFRAHLAHFSESPLASARDDSLYQASRLVFSNSSGKLLSWTNNSLLPRQDFINRLRGIPGDQVVQFDKNLYYQLRKSSADSTEITLIPIWIRYPIQNHFLRPFVFLGPYAPLLSVEELRAISVSLDDPGDGIAIHALDGTPVFYIRNLPVEPFRIDAKYRSLVLFIAGILSLLFGIFFLARSYRPEPWFADMILAVSVLAVRLLLYLLNFPGDFLKLPLFAPNLLAFHPLAPSVGEFTLNTLTFTLIVWLLYRNLFLRLDPFFHELARKKGWNAGFALLSLLFTALLLKAYSAIFSVLIFNSQLQPDFPNLFKIDIYAAFILLDTGMLLLIVIFTSVSLLRYNLVYSAAGSGIGRFSLQVGIAIPLFMLAGWGDTGFAITGFLTLLLWFVALLRNPRERILRYDLANYLILLFSAALIVTWSLEQNLERKRMQQAENMADRVLGNEAAAIVLDFELSLRRMQNDAGQIRERFNNSKDPDRLLEYLREEYLGPNFEGFQIRLFMYDSTGLRLDRQRNFEPGISPDADITAEEVGTAISDQLYQLPYFGEGSSDYYRGKFELPLSDTQSADFVLELYPTRPVAERLYPALLQDERVNEKFKQVAMFDFALYRNGVLYSKSGKTSFPLYLEIDSALTDDMVSSRDYVELVRVLDNNKVVILRYPKQKAFDLLSVFSFVFFFFSLSVLLCFLLPAALYKWLNTVKTFSGIPLRHKLQMLLVSISVMPLIVILFFLSPYIGARFKKQAYAELSAETDRIKHVIEEEYLLMLSDPFGRIARTEAFRERVMNLGASLNNDINVFDENGRLIASTQPLIFETGISSGLMDPAAFRQLRAGQTSELITTEKIGNLSYFSAYRPILTTRPEGYVNVPYLAKQDQLDEQLVNLLSYLTNIYLVVFLLIGFIAAIASNAITQPLLLIQQKLAETRLGNVNDPLEYRSRDEIGAIVDAYNEMVVKLAESEGKLARTQREMAWRQMARQVAHEIKNPLTPMKLSIQHLQRTWQEDPEKFTRMFPKVLRSLLAQIDSLVNIANSFSEFAKMPEPKKSAFVLNDVLWEAVDLYGLTEEVEIIADIPETDLSVFADREQLARAIHNVIKNALQAIEGNGIIRVSAKPAGKKVYIDIQDNGSGIAEDLREKIFQPNFSTKSSGMGLGLAIVKKIIENAGGSITFISEAAEGTTFHIELPLLDQA